MRLSLANYQIRYLISIKNKKENAAGFVASIAKNEWADFVKILSWRWLICKNFIAVYMLNLHVYQILDLKIIKVKLLYWCSKFDGSMEIFFKCCKNRKL